MLRSAWPIACELVGLCGSLILPLWPGNVCSDSQLPSRDRARMDCTSRRAAVQGLARDAARPVAVARKAHLRRFIRVHRLLWSATLDRQVLGRPPTSGAPTPKGRAAVQKFRSGSRRTATGPKLRGHDWLQSATTGRSQPAQNFESNMFDKPQPCGSQLRQLRTKHRPDRERGFLDAEVVGILLKRLLALVTSGNVGCLR